MIQSIHTQAQLEAANAQLGGSLPYTDDLRPLAQPLTVGTRTVPNRVAYQAMEGCDGTRSGSPDELTIRRYHRFAKGGPGVIWFEATAVQQDGRANPRQLYMTPDNLDDFARLVSEIKEICMRENGYEPLVFCQLTHSGRYSKPDGVPAPLIAYNNPIFEKDHPIAADRILTDDALDRIGEHLVASAQLAERAGFDGADIKCCHRYLLCELLSAYERPGKYGGSYENRTRLLRESVRGAIAACGSEFLISTRMNAYDGFPYPYGFGVQPDNGIVPDWTEAIRLVGDLKDEGVKIVNITMGNPYFNPHVNRPYNHGGYVPPEEPFTGVNRMLTGIAEIQRAHPDVPIISSGLTWLSDASANVAAACIRDGWFAMAGYGRMTLAYPDIARTIVAGERPALNRCCIACSKCTEIMRTPGGTPGCVIRDSEVYLPIYKKQCK